MNIVAIDPSKISTGMVVNGKLFNYTTKDNACNKSGLKKWYELFHMHITYRYIEYQKFNTYEEEQLFKLQDFDKVTNLIISDILENIDPEQPTVVGAEGMSFSSQNGIIIDLSFFSAILRLKILNKITDNIIILSPSTLKQEACKMTYPSVNIGKKVEKLEWRNFQGVSGGAFTKNDMYLSLIENTSFKDIPYVKLLNSYRSDMLEQKIPKPLEDVNDSFLIYQYLKTKY